jgi:nitrogen fixation NifU-like protein
MALDKLYQHIILEHNRHPLRCGRLPLATHSARGVDGLCGDNILIELIIQDGVVQEAMFSGEACAVTKASASMLMHWVVGRPLEDIRRAGDSFRARMTSPDLNDDPDLGDLNHLRAVADFPARVKNALLPWETLARALTETRSAQHYSETP